jgi:hypothetical protein
MILDDDTPIFIVCYTGTCACVRVGVVCKYNLNLPALLCHHIVYGRIFFFLLPSANINAIGAYSCWLL